MDRVRFPDAASCVGLVYSWFSSLFRGFFSGYSGFPLPTKTNISKFQFRPGDSEEKSHSVDSPEIPIYCYFIFIYLFNFFFGGGGISRGLLRRCYILHEESHGIIRSNSYGRVPTEFSMFYSVYSQQSQTRYFSKSIFGNNRQIMVNHHPVKRKKKNLKLNKVNQLLN